MRRALPWVAYFLAVFFLAFVFLFPVESLARTKIAEMEQRTGLSIAWNAASWSLFGSTLRDVTIADGGGKALVSLSVLSVSPRGQSLELEGEAPWGILTGSLGPRQSRLHVEGLPMPSGATMILTDGKLTGTATFTGDGSSVQGEFKLNGKAALPLYQGPLAVSGTVDLRKGVGPLVVSSISGDNLRGRGSLQVNAPVGGPGGAEGDSPWIRSHGLADLQVSGTLDVEYAGLPQTLSVQGKAGNWTVVPVGVYTPGAPGTSR
ncbi:MAG: hypothetical protein FJX76_06965 [Armatimonadetes bacterium]|nr:hypothetical protein [Armatimonadota bacterium]